MTSDSKDNTVKESLTTSQVIPATRTRNWYLVRIIFIVKCLVTVRSGVFSCCLLSQLQCYIVTSLVWYIIYVSFLFVCCLALGLLLCLYCCCCCCCYNLTWFDYDLRMVEWCSFCLLIVRNIILLNK